MKRISRTRDPGFAIIELNHSGIPEEELRQAMAMEDEKRTQDDWKQDPGLDGLDLSDKDRQ